MNDWSESQYPMILRDLNVFTKVENIRDIEIHLKLAIKSKNRIELLNIYK